MPDYDFNLTINPKPEGNFRPQVDVTFSFPRENLPHNPYIDGIHLILPYSQLNRVSENDLIPFDNFCSNYLKGFLMRRRAIGMFPSNNIILPEAIYVGDDQTRKGSRNDPESFESLRITNWKFFMIFFGSIIGMLFLGQFIKILAVIGLLGLMFSFPLAVITGFDFFPFRLNYYRYTLVPEGYPDEFRNTERTFYLPCRDGKQPDYSDFVNLFKQIPGMLEKQFKSGSTSGSTERIIINLEKSKKDNDDIPRFRRRDNA